MLEGMIMNYTITIIDDGGMLRIIDSNFKIMIRMNAMIN